MKVDDLKKGEKYYYAKLDFYPVAFSFVLLGKEKCFELLGAYYKLFYRTPFNNFICELVVIEDCVNTYRKFNESNPSVLKITDALFISKDKALLAKEVRKYYHTQAPIGLNYGNKKYHKVIKELKNS